MPFSHSFSPLDVEQVDAFQWRLTRPLEYAGAREGFTVPADFVTDFASVPSFLWSIFPPSGRHTRAAVLHDWLYVSGATSRADADGLFRRAMKELGVAGWRRWAMWAAVRLFGGPLWAKARAKDSKAG